MITGKYSSCSRLPEIQICWMDTEYVKMRSLDVSYMPDVVLDKLFSKLTDEDLRRVYQVSHLWKNAVLRRPGVNRRREEFVNKIRQNKENIIKGKEDSDRTDANRTTRSDRSRDTSNNTNEKPGSRNILNDFGNQLKPSVADNTLPNGNLSHGFSSPLNSSTPVQRGEKWQHAERSLKKGQRLFRCTKCYGPVASPVASKIDESSQTGTGSSININTTAEFRLTRMASLEDISMKPRERKKQRSLVKSSPSSFSKTHEDICSLSDMMAHRLIISPEIVSLERIRPESAPPVCTSFNFNYNQLTPINTNFNYSNNLASSSDAIDCLSPQNLQDSSDSGFIFMSYINSDEESSISQLNFSSPMFTRHPVKKQIPDNFSPLVNVNQSEGIQFGSSDSLFRRSFCKILNSNSGFNFSKESERSIIKTESPSNININLFPKTTFGLSQPSPLGLSVSMMNSSVNLDESFVLECPDCSYKFCSSCEESEHVGRPCRVIDSDSFRLESQDEPLKIVSIVSPLNNSGPKSKSNSNSSKGSKGKGKGSAKEERKKRLRRLAKN